MATNKSTESIDDKAFQALEEALKIDFDDLAPETPSRKDASEARASEPASRGANKTGGQPAAGEAPRSLNPEPAPKAPVFTPANDGSRRTPAAILKSLDMRSSRGPIRMAILASVLWVIGGLGVANLLYAPQIWQIRSVADLVALPGAIGMVVAIIMPIMLFFAFAIMIARAHELRSAARSMAEVALRLSEPETVAADRIMSVGQAVRREVSAMNEGIERTIARATELETLVHSEVNA
ncbi:MAG: kinesin, partial [Rhizobiales bacterium]|nr:kinesin [Hyphomicrobiales bacterium]